MNCPLCNAASAQVCDREGRSFHCQVCDLRFLAPHLRLDRNTERERYLEHENDVNCPGLRAFVAPLVGAVLPRLQLRQLGLDFGAGFAPVLQTLFCEAGFSTEAYDPFFRPQFELLERRYDFVVSSEVVEHFFTPAEEFRRLRQLLKPHGWLGIMTLIFDPETMDFESWYYRRDPTHVVFYSRATFRWIAKNFGFLEPEFLGPRVALFRTHGNYAPSSL